MKAVWEEVTAKEGAPGARSSHAIAAVDRRVFLFGGEFAPRVPIDNEMYAFDLDSKIWTVVEATGDVPGPRIGVGMVALGPVLYVFGGRDADHTELNELFSFNTLTGSWALLSKDDASPPARSYHAMAASASELFMFGGCGSSGRLNDLWAFNGTSGKWVALPAPDSQSSCVPRGGAGLVVVEGAVWVLFGFCGHELNDVHKFDLETKAWQEVKPESTNDLWPSGRSVFGSISISNKKILLYGGEIDPSDLGHEGAGKFSPEMFEFDVNSGKWGTVEQSGAKPGGRGWFPVAPLPFGMVLYGGNSESNDRLEDMFVLKLEG